jgi:sec-independent protein translocase protein TatA
MFGIGPTEMLVVGIVAVILFGSRLPSVARSLGQSIVEFKKGMRDLENDVKSSIHSEPTGRVTHRDKSEPSAPKFEPPSD